MPRGFRYGFDYTQRYTMINGRLFDAATMNEIGARKLERKKFFWQ